MVRFFPSRSRVFDILPLGRIYLCFFNLIFRIMNEIKYAFQSMMNLNNEITVDITMIPRREIFLWWIFFYDFYDDFQWVLVLVVFIILFYKTPSIKKRN